MTGDNPFNVAASVRQRLLNIIRQTGDDANLVWTSYATERLLYRLSISEYAGEFILKGAKLFMAWTGRSYRPTIDMDFLGYGEDSSERIAEVFRNVCAVIVDPDGLEFIADSVKTTPIRKEQEYHGQRVTMTAFLGKAPHPHPGGYWLWGCGDTESKKDQLSHHSGLSGSDHPCVPA